MYRPGADRVLKYAYSQPLPWELSLRNVLATFGLADFRARISGLSLGLGDSYHLEVETPPEVRLARARLFGSYVDRAGTSRVTVGLAEGGDAPAVNLHAARPAQDDLEAAEQAARIAALPWYRRMCRRLPPLEVREDPLEQAAAGRPSPVQRSDRGFAVVSFRPMLAGTFLAATVTSVLATALLVGARSRLAELDGQVGSAVLLALPILAAGYLVRLGEHAFATRLLRGVRSAALLVGVCSLVVAALLGAGFVDRPPRPPGSLAGTRPTHGDVRCTEVTPPAPALRVPEGMQLAVDIATIVAAAATVVLLLGLVRTWGAPRAGRQEDLPDDDLV